jgi:O-antigen ligase
MHKTVDQISPHIGNHAGSPRGQLHESQSQGNILRYALLILVIWAPLPAASNWPWSSALLICLIAGMGIFWAFQRQTAFLHPLGHNNPSVPQQPHQGIKAARGALLLLICTLVWMCLQWALGITSDTGETFRYGLLAASYTLLFWLVINLFNTRKQLTLLLATLILSGTLQAFYGAFMTLSGIEWLLTGPKEYNLGLVTGTFVNRNHLAGYLEMTIACGIGLMLALRDGKSFNWQNALELLVSTKIMIRLCLVIMVIALVMTQSRMGNTAFFLSLMIVGSLFVLINKEYRLRNGLILASLILIDVVVISQYFGLENLKNRIVQTQLEDALENGEIVRRENVDRDDVAEYALQLIKARPLGGFGAGSFEASFQKYAGPDVLLDFDHAHNDFIQFVAELGMIGSLPLALFVILCLYQALAALWNRESLYRSGVGFGAAMGIIALMIHSSADFNLQIPANSVTFVVLCAIAILARHHTNDRTYRKH